MHDPVPMILGACLAGLAGGLVLLFRGMGGYRTAIRVGDTSTSRVATLAAGEVRVTGTIEAAEVTLTSPLGGHACVWYRSRIVAGGDGEQLLFSDERAIGFRLRDATGSIRVFPRDARIDAPTRLDDRDSFMGERPAGVTIPDDLVLRPGQGTRHYTELRLEPGDVVTVVGTALPFGHLADPDDADRLDRHGDPLAALDDPVAAMDIAEAREAGILVSPEEAWGNAAIPGFGIGRPVREPELDPAASRAVLATAAEAAAIGRTWDIDPDLLVLAAGTESPLLVASGAPGEVVAREEGRFLVGLLGAVLAIGSAIVGAIVLATR